MIVGIDLGTTNSSISAYINGEVKLIPNSFGEVLTPSVVSFDSDGTYYVGAVAKERLVTNPETTFKEFKRQMGSECSFKAYRKSYKPEELSALVLKQLKEDAEKYTGETINDAVISVPAYFTNKQRAATRNAGLIAGLNVICLINEPSAAALTYHEKNIERDEKYLVFDFGGGTLDVTLVDAFDNIIEIQSISGDNYLGGSDFNRVIAIDICDKNNIKWTDLSKEELAILTNHGEEIKIALTDAESCTHKVVLNNKEYEYSLDRQGLLDISGEIFSKITIVLKRIMNDAGINIEDIDGVIMIGGSSKMPVIQLFLNTLFNGQARYESNGDTIVCEGAGIVAGIKERKDEVKDLILTDIAPFSLGTETVGNVFSVIIPKNQVLPCSKVNYYTTTYDNQKEIEFKVYQGENIMASNNQLLGEYRVKIEQRPRGEVHVAARYSYDLNGIFDIDISGDGVLKEVHASIGDVSGQSREDIIRRREEMEKLKVNPMSQEENVLLVEKAGRLAAECNSEQRTYLQAALLAYVDNCKNGSLIASTEAKRRLEIVIQQIEASMFSFSDFDADLWHKYIEGFDADKDKED